MKKRREILYFYLFVGPWIVGFLVFMAYPLLMSAYYSLTEYNAASSPVFIGLRNYQRIFQDDLFYKSVWATLHYTLVSVPIGMLLSLFFASLLNRKIPGRGVFRTFLYLPSMISGVALSLLWMWIFNPDIGFLNYMFSLFGIPPQQWIYDARLAIPSLVIMSFWGLGSSTIIFLAALQGVPSSLYEAAELDGCPVLIKLFRITLPMISPVFLFQLVTSMIAGFQAFTQAFIMTRGGPSYATHFYVYYLYQKGFADFELGYSSALAWIMMAVIVVITIFILKVSGRFVYSEERN